MFSASINTPNSENSFVNFPKLMINKHSKSIAFFVNEKVGLKLYNLFDDNSEIRYDNYIEKVSPMGELLPPGINIKDWEDYNHPLTIQNGIG